MTTTVNTNSLLASVRESLEERPLPLKEKNSAKGTLNLTVTSGTTEEQSMPPSPVIALPEAKYEMKEGLEKIDSATLPFALTERDFIQLFHGEKDPNQLDNLSGLITLVLLTLSRRSLEDIKMARELSNYYADFSLDTSTCAADRTRDAAKWNCWASTLSAGFTGCSGVGAFGIGSMYGEALGRLAGNIGDGVGQGSSAWLAAKSRNFEADSQIGSSNANRESSYGDQERQVYSYAESNWRQALQIANEIRANQLDTTRSIAGGMRA